MFVSDYELLVREVSPAELGAACDPTGVTSRCRSGVCARVSATTAQCVTPRFETEPNNTPAAATMASAPGNVSFGASLAAPDVDCFGVQVTSGQSLIAYTHDGNGRCPDVTNPFANTHLRLHDPTGAMIAANDNAPGLDGCSRIDGGGSGLPLTMSGRYTVCVEQRSVAIGSYYVSVAVF